LLLYNIPPEVRQLSECDEATHHKQQHTAMPVCFAGLREEDGWVVGRGGKLTFRMSRQMDPCAFTFGWYTYEE
jgi:hypothetical protein